MVGLIYAVMAHVQHWQD